MINKFIELINRPESATLDFKLEVYRLSEDWSQADLIKDVLCMANTPREETSYIVLGVAKQADGTFVLCGINKQIDGNDLQTQFVDRVYPVPIFSYEPILHEGKHFGIIVIPPIRQGPCLLRTDFKTFLKQRQVFLRRDSTNAIALSEDITRIVKWIQGSCETSSVRCVSEHPGWDDFLVAAHDFDSTRNYILVASPLDKVDMPNMKSLGKVPWTSVFDFDPKSEVNGLLSDELVPGIRTTGGVRLFGV